MKTSNYSYSVRLDPEEQIMRKATQERPADITKHNRELKREIGDALHRAVKLDAKSSAKSSRLCFIPILRPDCFDPRSLREDGGWH